MKKRKRILAVLIAASLLLTLWYSWRVLRLEIIRASLAWDLPGWIQALIWGWR